MALSAAKLKGLPEGRHADSDGLYFRVRGNSKSWILRTVVAGKRKDITLGKYPAMTLDKARSARDEAKEFTSQGLDPVREEKKAAVIGMTVAEAIEATFASQKASLKGAGKNGRWMSPLEQHIIPQLGSLPIADLTADDIERVLLPIWTVKTSAAKKALQRLGMTVKYAYAKRTGVDPNVCVNAKTLLGNQGHQVKNHPSMPWADVGDFYASLGNLNAELALKLTILTASRQTPVRLATVGQFDLETGVWTVPGENMKSTKAKARDFKIPLSPEAIRVVEGGYQLQASPSERSQDLLKQTVKERRTAWDRLAQGWDRYERTVGSTELAARMSVYKAELAKGKTEADAAQEAINFIDFNRRGSSSVARKLGFMVLFLNPRIQGLYRLFETGGRERRNRLLRVGQSLAVRGAIMTAVSLALRGLIYADEETEEDYRAINTQQKASYYHIPIGKDANGATRFAKIPRAFEVGAVFSALPEQLFATIAGEDGWDDVASLASHTFMETFSFNPTPEILRPIAEVMLNHNMYTGRPIEGMRLESYPKELRADLRTGGLAKALGNRAVSPAQLQHLISAYLGPLFGEFYNTTEGVMAGMGLVDPKQSASLSAFGDLPPALRKPIEFGVGRFVSRTDSEASTKYISDFYSLHTRVKEFTSAINEAKRNQDFETVQRLVEQSKVHRSMKPQVNAAYRKLSKLNQQMRGVVSSDLPQDEKNKRLRRINFEKNQITRRVVDEARRRGLKQSGLEAFFGLSPRG